MSIQPLRFPISFREELAKKNKPKGSCSSGDAKKVNPGVSGALPAEARTREPQIHQPGGRNRNRSPTSENVAPSSSADGTPASEPTITDGEEELPTIPDTDSEPTLPTLISDDDDDKATQPTTAAHHRAYAHAEPVIVTVDTSNRSGQTINWEQMSSLHQQIMQSGFPTVDE